MAHVILGGLVTSTVLTMLVVPAAYARFGWEPDDVFRSQQDREP
jgi:Cu/Ag efflux pump CusA